MKRLTLGSHGWPRFLTLALCLAANPLPGQDEGPTVTAPTDTIQRQIAEAEAALAEMESLARQWETRAEAEVESLAEQISEVARLEGELRDGRRGSEAAGAVFERSKELLRETFDDLEAAIRRATDPSDVPRHPAPAAGRCST